MTVASKCTCRQLLGHDPGCLYLRGYVLNEFQTDDEPEDSGIKASMTEEMWIDFKKTPIAAHGYSVNPSYLDDNPKTALGIKKLPLQNVPSGAIISMAVAMADGAQKYGPYNWREKRVTMSIYLSAALRHIYAFIDGEETAEDSGASHLGHAMACLGIIEDARSIDMINDDRPNKGAAAGLLKYWEKKDDKKIKGT